MKGWYTPRKIKEQKRLDELERLGITKDSLANLYLEKKYSIPDLCSMFPGVSIYSWLKKWNIPRRKISEGFHITKMRHLQEKGITKEFLEDLYINQKLSCRDIDKRLGFGVSYYLKYFGISKRKNTEHNSFTIWTDLRRRHISEALKEYWSSPICRNGASERIKKRIASGWKPDMSGLGVMRLPSKGEVKLTNIINLACPDEYLYVGNNKIKLRTKYGNIKPDFIHVNKKKIIEFFGDYWHGERGSV